MEIYVTPTLFIPSQDPDFDVSFSQLLYCLWHTILQLVLHSCRPQKLKTNKQDDIFVNLRQSFIM